jgi:carbonic anhydrase
LASEPVVRRPTPRTTRRSLSDEYRRLLAESERYADQHDRSQLAAPPLAGLAVLTCMDTRIVVEDIFGLRAGDVNVVRNAGAVASDDAVRSLILSHHVLGTREVVVLAHTGCGLRELDDENLRSRLEAETGQTSGTHFGSFTDLDAHVRRQVERITTHPWIGAVPVHGLVYEVETGRVREIV